MDNNSKEIEEWRDAQWYEGLYQVSSLGRVRSLDRLVDNGRGIYVTKGRILKPGMDKDGYLHVFLCKDGKPTIFSVHRLAYEAFNGKIPEGMQVNHIDEDKTNNRLDNLNLMTPKENTNWGTGIERRAKKHSKPIIQYSLNGDKLAEYPSVCDAARKLTINIGNISSALKGMRKTAGGYIFRYKS